MTDTGTSSLIRLRAVTRKFSTEDVETHALSEVDLDIHDRDFVAISGPSGSGKSTLLSILGLLDAPSSGSYRLADAEVSTLSADERARLRCRRIGFIFQSFNLLDDLTVLENVELPLRYQGVPVNERRDRAMDAIRSVGMHHRAKHFPNQLSGGQQQRVAVARAVVTRPLILLADEPTGNLDTDNSRAIMDLLAMLHAEGTTICMVTHDPHNSSYSNRQIHILDGRIRPPEEAERHSEPDA